MNHRQQQVCAAQSNADPVPNRPAPVDSGEAGCDQKTDEERHCVKGIGHGNGAPGDAYVGERREDLGSVGGEAIEQDVGQESPKKQRHPASQVRVRGLPCAAEVTPLAVPPPPQAHERDVQRKRQPLTRRKNHGQKVHHEAHDDCRGRLGAHGDPSVVTAAVELVGRPPKDESPHNGEQERMADASVKAQVVELAQKVLAEHVHVWNGAGHGTPNHRTVPDSASQHRFANGGTKHDLRQRIHSAKVGRHPWFLSTPGHNSWLFHMKHTPILSLCLLFVLSGLFPQDAQAQSESTTFATEKDQSFVQVTMNDGTMEF